MNVMHDETRKLEIDGLRGLAATGVLLLHAGVGPMFWAWSCVDLFFVLSGFLITGILLQLPAGRRQWRDGLKNFLMRRVLRIWPVYYLTLVLAIGLQYFGSNYSSQLAANGMPALSPYFFFLQFGETYIGDWTPFEQKTLGTFFHSWSVAVEEQFYIFWPFLVILLRRYPALLALSCLAVFAVSAGLRASGWPSYILIARADGLALGALLAVLWAHYRQSVIRYRYLFLLPLLAGIALVCEYLARGALYNLLGAQSRAEALAHIDPNGLVAGFALVYTGILALILANTVPVMQQLLSTRPLRYLGEISYALYMFHVPMMIVLAEILGASAGTLKLILLPLTIMAAHCSLCWLERPISTLKVKFPTN